MRPGLPLLVAYLAAPLLVVQGMPVRRTTPRLPEATGLVGLVGTGASGSAGDGAEALHIAVIGDSVAAGVGVGRHADTIAGQLAGRLSVASGRPVAWTVVARSGADVRDVRSLLIGCERPGGADDASVGSDDGLVGSDDGLVGSDDGLVGSDDGLVGACAVVVSVGVNDVLGLRSDRRWRADLSGLLDDIARLMPDAEVVLLGVPPMQAFPALPRLLGALLGHRARRLDVIGREVCADRPQVRRLDLVLEESPGLFADDGFHPSAAVHDRLATQIHALLARRM